jgi:hypothetical protein
VNTFAQQGQTLGRARLTFVGDVVGSTGKVVDRNDGRTHRRRAKPGGDREVLVVIDAHRA